MAASVKTILTNESITISTDQFSAPQIIIEDGATRISITLTAERAAMFLALARSKFNISEEEVEAAKKKLGL